MRLNLRTFLLAVLATCAVVCFTADYFVNAPTRLDHIVTGAITSGDDARIDPLTHEELEHSLARQIIDEDESWTPDIATATIEEQRIIIEESENIPLIGRAELHRVIYRCVVDGVMENGESDERVFLIEKQHFHML